MIEETPTMSLQHKTLGTLFVLGLVAAPVMADSLPSSKAAVAINELIDLSQVASGPPASSGDTGWVNNLQTQIKTASQKDLLFDVSLQCGIVTDTTFKSSGGNTFSPTARA